MWEWILIFNVFFVRFATPNDGFAFSESVPEAMKHEIKSQVANISATMEIEVERIDYFKIPNSMHGSGVLWAWHAGDCNGLSDSTWAPSRGAALGNMITNEERRLRSFGVLRHGGVAVDIGAHMGDSTIPMALLANQTIAFDPSMLSYPFLSLNAAMNSDLNIQTFNMAVGNQNGEIQMEYGSSECNGNVGVKDPNNPPGPNTKRVTRPTVDLKPFLETTYGSSIIQRVAFIKIDCEGFDHVILTALRPMIAEMRVKPIIQVEYFAPHMLEDVSNQGVLGAPTVSLIRSIQSLPGHYALFCTKQCNSAAACDYRSDDEVLIKVRKGPEGAQIMLVHKGEESRGVECDDFMLVPSSQRAPHGGAGAKGVPKTKHKLSG